MEGVGFAQRFLILRKEIDMRVDKSYISVSGIVDATQIRELSALVPGHTHKMGVSYIATPATIRDPGHMFPSNLIVHDPCIFNILHCVNQPGGWTPDVFIEAARRSIGCGIHALHLDMTWPSVKSVRIFRDLYPDIALIFQVGGGGMSVGKGDEVRLVNELYLYGKMVDVLLFDRWVAHGHPMMISTLRRFLGHVQRNLRTRLALVEELQEYSIDVVLSLFKDFPNLSLHLEGIRDVKKVSAGFLDIARIKEFLEKARPIIQRFTPDPKKAA